MKNMLLVGAILIVATAAFAAPPKKKAPAPAPTTIKCAVMTGNTVNIKAATASKMYADYKGNRYYFCCGMCPEAFKKDPAKYAKNAHLPTPKPALPAKKS